jgi:hypothetical protein
MDPEVAAPPASPDLSSEQSCAVQYANGRRMRPKELLGTRSLSGRMGSAYIRQAILSDFFDPTAPASNWPTD